MEKLWKLKKSRIHNKGIFAKKEITKNTKIIEYIGEKITKQEGDTRSEARIKKFLKSKTHGSVYIFELNNKYDIDGSPLYNKARYINHSCDPNCEVKINKGRIWVCSIKHIAKDEELSYDYGYEFDKDDYKDHICNCGSNNCIGYIISSDDWPKYKRFKNRNKKMK